MGLTIGVDIGGTKIAAGVVDESGRIIAEDLRDTPATDPAALAAAVADLVGALRTDHEIEAVGIGAAGFVDATRSTVLFAPNIDWSDEPLAARVRAFVDLPVIVENDANAAAWGEFRFGAGSDVDNLMLVTIGTGIGAGVIDDGQLFRGGFGVAAQVRHLRMVPAGIRCGCGQYGCWEQYGSGRALVREAEDRIRVGMEPARHLSELSGGDPEAVTGPMVTEAARAGDPLSIDLISDVGSWVGQGLASLAAVLDPTTIAIGGGVAAAGDLLMSSVQDGFVRHLPAGTSRPHAELRLAALGNEAGLIGAADLARVP
ncbi:MAG: ROK family glucokinase [Actinomycetia bacterium]|nr:ROK family glucokinase [Actinomycetes bacterium]